MNEKSESPKILALVRDVYFLAAIEGACRRLGYELAEWDAHSQNYPLDLPASEDKNYSFLEFASRLQPSLVIVDLNLPGLPWKEWISLLKSSPETSHLPILCFGPHVNTALLEEARRAGADAVLARSRFMSGMGEVIGKYMRRRDA